ncbi:hypothetical protein LJC74_04050 [Eubacteriales bacterium OttesenSCG-928-A19]|nr:hypothetical protein [Eubacteriales bacterium OttesenSCG-928-A19]
MSGIALSPDYLNDCKGKAIMYSLSYMCEDPQYGEETPWIGFQIVYNLDDGTTTSRYWNWAHLFPAGSTKAWTRTQGTGSIPENAESVASAMCTIQRAYVSGTIRIRQPMIELSSKASDYRPAPEDDPNRLTLAESRITQNANNINLKVSQSIYDQEKIYRSTTAPASPSVNMLWLNTGTSPYVLSRWNGASWITVGADKVIASGINITPNDITFRTTNLLFQLLDPANNENILMEMRANGLVGFKELYADNIVSPAIVPAYRLTNNLYISTVSIGNYYNVFFNVREACAFINGKYIKEDVTISFWTQTAESIYDNEGIVIEGISGPGT